MAVLQVLHIPDERLRKVAEPVKEVNAEIQRIVDDMFDTMYAEEASVWPQPRSISISALSLLMCRKIVKSSWY